jgi:Protein of unknown function (DUF1449)
MNEFLNAITTFPGLIPSILVGVILVFGLIAMAGFLDIHHIGPDWHFDLNHDGHADIPDVLAVLGFGRMPFFVVVSSIGFFWWFFTVAAQIYLLPFIPILPSWLVGTLTLIAAFALALPPAAFCIRPLRPIFARRVEGIRPIDFVGRHCKILTSGVDEKFGQAEVSVDAGAPHNLRVYASTPNELRRGSSALILYFDAKSQRYEVEAYDP